MDFARDRPVQSTATAPSGRPGRLGTDHPAPVQAEGLDMREDVTQEMSI